jgi:hypothetical protein
MAKACWSWALALAGVIGSIGCGSDDNQGTSVVEHHDAEAGSPEATPDAASEGSADTEVPETQSIEGDGTDEAMALADGQCADTEWRDLAAGTCRACPAPGVSCASLSASGTISINLAMRTISLDIGPGRAEIVSASVSVSDCVAGIPVLVDYFLPQGNILPSAAPISVSGGGSFCLGLEYTVADRCGDTFEFTIQAFYDQNLKATMILPCPDAGGDP